MAKKNTNNRTNEGKRIIKNQNHERERIVSPRER